MASNQHEIDPAIYCPSNWVKLLSYYQLNDHTLENSLPLHPIQHYCTKQTLTEIPLGDTELAKHYDQLNACSHDENDCPCPEQVMDSNQVQHWHSDLQDAVIQRREEMNRNYVSDLGQNKSDFLAPLNLATDDQDKITGIDYAVGLSLLTKISKRMIEHLCTQERGIYLCIMRYGHKIKPLIEQCRLIQQLNNVLQLKYSWRVTSFGDQLVPQLGQVLDQYRSQIEQWFGLELEDGYDLDSIVYLVNLLYWTWSGVYFVPEATYGQYQRSIESCTWHTVTLPPTADKITKLYLASWLRPK